MDNAIVWQGIEAQIVLLGIEHFAKYVKALQCLFAAADHPDRLRLCRTVKALQCLFAAADV